jgi:hypothetical protein
MIWLETAVWAVITATLTVPDERPRVKPEGSRAGTAVNDMNVNRPSRGSGFQAILSERFGNRSRDVFPRAFSERRSSNGGASH